MFSVIMPTYNRRQTLLKALQGYLSQSAMDRIAEILVIDDGSQDGTETSVREFCPRSPIPIRYFRQDNRGAAAARNVGIRNAQGSLLLFSDDDVIPGTDMVKEHFEWQEKFPQPNVAVLGYMAWAPEVHATPFMRWYGENALFAYRRVVKLRELDFYCFYTCNVSVKADFLRSRGMLFDERFKGAAFEDTELGYRLQKSGLRILYNRRAVGYHHQNVTFHDACLRAQWVAQQWRVFGETEAGRQVKEERAQARPTLRSRVGIWLTRHLGKPLSVLEPLFDSQIPLPTRIYHIAYWYQVPAPEPSERVLKAA